MTEGSGRRLGAAALAVAASLAVSAVAIAASPLHKGKVYNTGGGIGARFTLTLITSATNAGRLVAGPASPPAGSQFAISTGSVRCPTAPHNPGLVKGSAPFALFSFPGANLELRHGKLGFSVRKTVAKQEVLGSPVKPFKFTVKIAGMVSSATKITGTVTASGGPCTIKHPLAWTAVYRPQDMVGPGA